MEDRDIFKDLISDKLKDASLPVKDKLWSNISSQIGQTTVATSTGLSVITKIIIGSSIVAASIGTIVFLNSNSDKNKKIEEVENIKENSSNLPSSTSEIKNIAIEENNVEYSESMNISEVSNTLVDTETESIEIKEFNHNYIVSPSNTKDEDQKISPIIIENKTESKHNEVKDPVKEDIKVNNSPKEVLPKEDYSLKLANIFTPNNDGTNDLFFVESEGLSDFSIVIMDQQNKMVYSSDHSDFKWNGHNLNGDLVPVGKYIYFIVAKSKSGELVKKYQSLEVRY